MSIGECAKYPRVLDGGRYTYSDDITRPFTHSVPLEFVNNVEPSKPSLEFPNSREDSNINNQRPRLDTYPDMSNQMIINQNPLEVGQRPILPLDNNPFYPDAAQRGLIPELQDNAGQPPEIWLSTNPKSTDPLGQGDYFNAAQDLGLGNVGDETGTYNLPNLGYEFANLVDIVVQNFIYAFSGTPKALKTLEISNRFAGSTNPAVRNYFNFLRRLELKGVPISVSSGPYRQALDHQYTILINSLEAQGYPSKLARQLVNNIINGQGHGGSIFPTYAQYLRYHELLKQYGKVRHINARPSNSAAPASKLASKTRNRHNRRAA